MAGYFMYSLDGAALETFLDKPDDKLLLKLAEHISDALDYQDSKIEDGTPMASWPSDPKELMPVVKEHFAKKDWYSPFSDPEKLVWETAIRELCDNEECFGFECESDGVYWSIIDEAVGHFGGRKKASKMEVAHFGARPLRYTLSTKKKKDMFDWQPYHSMHLPGEVATMWEQFQEAEDSILGSEHEEVEDDYEELTRVFEKIIPANRALYISVDT